MKSTPYCFDRLRACRSIVILALFCALCSACSTLPMAQADTSTPAPPSATAAPTETATPTHSPTLTASPTATFTATPDSTGTAIARSTVAVDLFLETIRPDLEDYDIVLDSGRLAWSNRGTEIISLKTYLEETYKPLKDMPVTGDFLLQSEVLWDTSGGLAGCGFILRAERDMEVGEQYRFVMMRLQNLPGWELDIYKDGKWQSAITPNGALQFSKNIHDGRETVNKVALLVKGDQFTAFLNGQEMRTVTNDRISKGVIAMLGWQESGISRCEFRNTWVWSFDE